MAIIREQGKQNCLQNTILLMLEVSESVADLPTFLVGRLNYQELV
jgi:hypothetical protein